MIEIDIQKRIKSYEGFQRLRIQTSFVSGSITQITGNSGAGKTTLLKILAGLIVPESGTIRVNNQLWLDTKAGISLEPQKRGVGFVFQDYALFPHMTVESHLRYGTDDSGYIQRLLVTGRMESFVQHKPRQLSGGQQQRLAILRALSTKPKILLMDEPFSALDAALKSGVITSLKTLLAEMQITCLVVTHQPAETRDFAAYTFELA